MDQQDFDDLYEKLDVLLKSKDKSLFSIGDTANTLLTRMLLEDKFSQEEQVPLRTVLTALLDDLAGRKDGRVDHAGRFTHYFSSVDSARDRIATYIRVTRFFDDDRRMELPRFLTFSHFSAIYVGDKARWPHADEAETMKWLNWALTNRASPADIIAARMGRVEESYYERATRQLFAACGKFLLHYEGGEPELFKLVKGLVNYQLERAVANYQTKVVK